MNYLVDEFVFDLQLFAADFDPWADFDADETSEGDIPADDIKDPTDPDTLVEGDIVWDEDIAETVSTEGNVLLDIDPAKLTTKTYTKSDGTEVTVTVISADAITSAKFEGESSLQIGVYSFAINDNSIEVTFEDGKPVDMVVSEGETQVVLGGTAAIDIESDAPVTVELNENGLPGKAISTGNVTITVGDPVSAEVSEDGLEEVEFSGFPTSDEHTVEFSENGKHITAITCTEYEGATVTVTGALDYTLNGEEFELSNVAAGASYSFENLEDGIALDLRNTTAKNSSKPISVVETGGVDVIMPVIATNGGSIKIAGETYDYKTGSDSESRFVLDGNKVVAFVLDAVDDGIIVPVDSGITIIDGDNNEEFTPDVNASGGKYLFTKKETSFELGYIFTEGSSIEVSEDASVKLFFEDSAGKPYTVTPPVEGSYTLAMTGKNEFTISDFDGTEITVGGATLTFDDSEDVSVVLSAEAQSSDSSIAFSISGIEDLASTVKLDGISELTINGYDFKFTSKQDISVTGDGEGIVSATGFVTSDEVTVSDPDAEIKLDTDGNTASITVNGVLYTVSDDEGGITIDGSGNVDGLDEDAKLEISGETGTITVNGSEVDASGVIIGSYDGTKAYNYDPDHPIINKNTSVSDIEDMLGLSYTTDQIDVVLSGDKDYSSETEKRNVIIGEGNQKITFGEAGKNEVVVLAGSDGEKRLELGAKGDVVIVQDGADTDKIDVIGGAGADSIVIQDDSAVVFDMSKGGADKVMTFATSNAKVTLDSYDISQGGGLVIEESSADNIADAIGEGLIQFNDNSIVAIDRDNKGTAEITVKNKSGDPQTLINLFNYKGESQKVGFTGSDGGTLDTSKFNDDFILVGNDSGKKKASTLKAGAGDDTIFAGKGDQVDAGAGDNLVVLSENGGAKVIIAEGDTTINNLTTGFKNGDIISLSNVDDVSFDGTNLVLEGNGYTATAAVTESDGVVEQLIELNGQTLKAAIAADGQNISVSGSDVPNYFVGNAGVDFGNYSGDVTYDAATNSGTVGDVDAYFSKNITSITGGAGKTSLKGSDADDILVAGTGATSLYGGAGNNTLVGNSDQTAATEFVVLGNENGAANTIQNFQFGTDFINTDFEQNYISDVALVGNDVKLTVTKREGTTSETALIEGAIDGGNIKVGSGGDAVAVGQFGSTAVTVDGEATYFDAVTNGATVKVASTVTSKTNIWLANEERSDGKLFSDKFAVIDASGSVAELELAGNTAANTITAGSGNASLWGGSGSASDVLIGGSGQNSFYYELGNGADTINNANDGDTVNLFDTSLENIVSAEITSGGVVVQFTDGGSLTVNSNKDVNYVLKDGSTWSADHSNHTWNQKA